MSSPSPVRLKKRKEYVARKLKEPVMFPPLFDDATREAEHDIPQFNKSLYDLDMSHVYEHDVGGVQPLSSSQELKRHFDDTIQSSPSKKRAMSKDSSSSPRKSFKAVESRIGGIDTLSLRLPFLKQVFLNNPSASKSDSLVSTLLKENKVVTPATNRSGNHQRHKLLNDEEEFATLKTGDDAIAFFSRASKDTALKFVYLNRAPTKNDEYRPYDLVVTTRECINPEYFTMSSTGVIHMQQDQPTEYMSVSDWMKESTMFSVLRHMRMFKYYIVHKCFRLWYENVRFLKYKNKRAELVRNLFIAKQTFAQPLMEICKFVHGLGNVNIMEVRPVKPKIAPNANGQVGTGTSTITRENTFRIDDFLEIQKNLRMNAIREFESGIEEIEEIVGQLCESVTSRSRNQDVQDNIEQFLNGTATGHTPGPDIADTDVKSTMPGKKSKSMVEVQNEMRQRTRALRKAQQESDMLGNFIRLVDYMAVENLIDLTKHTLAEFRNVLKEKGNPLMFEVQMIFSDDSIKFQPNQDEIMVLLRHNSDEIIETVNQVPRILYMKRFKIHLQNLDRYVIQGDEVYNSIRREIEQMLNTDFKRSLQYGKIFEGLKRWYTFSMNWNSDEYSSKKQSLQQFTADTTSVNSSLNELYRVPVQQEIGILFIDSRMLKNTLLPMMQQILEKIKSTIVASLRDKCSALILDFSNRIKSLKDRPVKLKHFAQFLDNLNSVKKVSRDLLTESDEVEKMLDLALKHKALIGSKESVLVDQVKDISHEFLSCIESADEYRENNIAFQTEVLDKQTADVNNELMSLLMSLRTSAFVDPYAQASVILESLQMTQETIQNVKNKAEMYTEFHRLFNTNKSREWTNLVDVQTQHSLCTRIWRCHEELSRAREEWLAHTVDRVDCDAIRDRLSEFSESVRLLVLETGSDDPVIRYLEQCISAWQERVPLIRSMTNPHLLPHHWEALFKYIGAREYPTPTGGIGFTISLLDAMGAFVTSRAEYLPEWSRLASGEYALQESIDAIETRWNNCDFTVNTYNESNNMFVLGKVDDIVNHIEQDLNKVQEMRKSEFLTMHVLPRLDEWEQKLTIVNEVIEEWLSFQKTWIYLDILSSKMSASGSEDPIIKLSLLDDGDDYNALENFFREVMYRTSVNKNVFSCALEDGRLQEFARYNSWLEYVDVKIPFYNDQDLYDDSAILPLPPSYGRVLTDIDESIQVEKFEEEIKEEIMGEESNNEDDQASLQQDGDYTSDVEDQSNGPFE
ncbi:dynein heavy chain [Acrasis kona]|uniref:Dynein heavy chain n=1 Tax=Acrasis kona TaxID=1008807 RepID=A0AAW2YN15_9EUKA